MTPTFKRLAVIVATFVWTATGYYGCAALDFDLSRPVVVAREVGR